MFCMSLLQTFRQNFEFKQLIPLEKIKIADISIILERFQLHYVKRVSLPRIMGFAGHIGWNLSQSNPSIHRGCVFLSDTSHMVASRGTLSNPSTRRGSSSLFVVAQLSFRLQVGVINPQRSLHTNVVLFINVWC
jgi:hypothetical protein